MCFFAPDVSGKDRWKWIYRMRIDTAERFAFCFMYGNTQFRTIKQSIFSMKKVDTSFLVRLHCSIQNSSFTLKCIYVFIIWLLSLLVCLFGGFPENLGNSLWSSSERKTQSTGTVVIWPPGFADICSSFILRSTKFLRVSSESYIPTKSQIKPFFLSDCPIKSYKLSKLYLPIF